ncbi:unnamed protein product [Darwinula stevensoni]|uniref:Major facilitator superfamily (MFS) profile domain-containing protein n=1 Tax=Darwinula stevensoni TaxID=69355 RepID=A0A7R9A1A7_9CRUS|nr:unnamed protein product [Darwinula stevensoni]CAG0883069.1 unnamed protein product [Darwinula stevensoni]
MHSRRNPYWSLKAAPDHIYPTVIHPHIRLASIGNVGTGRLRCLVIEQRTVEDGRLEFDHEASRYYTIKRLPVVFRGTHGSGSGIVFADTKMVRSEACDPPDGGWSWVILSSASIVMLLATSMRSTFGLLFGEFLQDIQADPVFSSLIFNVTQTVWFTACLFVGSMCTVFSHRLVVLVGGSFLFLGMFSTVFVTSATQMFFSYSLFTGIGVSCCVSGSFLILPIYFNRHRGLALGCFNASASIGRVLFPLIIDALLSYYGSRGTFLILSGVAANTLVAAGLLHPIERHCRSDKGCHRLLPREKALKPLLAKEVEKMQKGLRNPLLLLVTLSDSLFWMSFSNFNFLLPIFVQEKGFGRQQAAVLLSVASSVDIVARIGLPVLVDRKLVHPRDGYIAGLVIVAAFAFLLPSLTTSMSWLVALSAIYGIGCGAAVSHYGLLLVHYFGLENLPVASSLTMFFKGIVVLGLGHLIGVLRDSTGQYDASSYLLGGSLVLAAGIWVFEPWITSKNREKSIQSIQAQASTI